MFSARFFAYTGLRELFKIWGVCFNSNKSKIRKHFGDRRWIFFVNLDPSAKASLKSLKLVQQCLAGQWRNPLILFLLKLKTNSANWNSQNETYEKNIALAPLAIYSTSTTTNGKIVMKNFSSLSARFARLLPTFFIFASDRTQHRFKRKSGGCRTEYFFVDYPYFRPMFIFWQ